jgi:hypothetical protein
MWGGLLNDAHSCGLETLAAATPFLSAALVALAWSAEAGGYWMADREYSTFEASPAAEIGRLIADGCYDFRIC